MALLLAVVGFAQNPANPNAKLNLVVGSFSGDHSGQQRVNVIGTLTSSHRANVIEQSAYEALPQEVRSKMRIDAVITGLCSLKVESEQQSRTDKNGNKRNVTIYKATFSTKLTFTNPANNREILTPIFESNSSDESRSEAVKDAIAIGHTRGKQTLIVVQLLTLEEYLEYIYPLRGKCRKCNNQSWCVRCHLQRSDFRDCICEKRQGEELWQTPCT